MGEYKPWCSDHQGNGQKINEYNIQADQARDAERTTTGI